VVEETPSPLLTPQVREEMGKFAVAAAKAVSYSGAGTIEFIVDEDLQYYFLEMNTRLQVEHPITERVVGVDLVKEQIRVANNEVLKLKQEELKQRGHAIECRIYAEDPDRNFMPSPGVIKHITEPHGLGVRCDGYVYEGYEIPLYYDPMISKLICWGKTRDEAIARMKRALYEYKITGVKTSIRLLVRIMDTPDFKEGKYNTHFIEKNRDFLFTIPPINPRVEDVALMTVFVDYLTKINTFQTKFHSRTGQSNWKECGRRKNMNG
jgi:acetyl-CoA carboxylase biotin carboxylase subunit